MRENKKMNEGSRGLREVVPNQCYIPQLREFTVTTGAAFSTLQDIKLPDSAGEDNIFTFTSSLRIFTFHQTLQEDTVIIMKQTVPCWPTEPCTGGRTETRWS